MSLTHHTQTSVPKRGHISCNGYLWVYSTCHKKLYKIRRPPQKFCAVSMRIPQSFCAANCGIAVLVLRSVSHFRGMILCCPRNDVQYRYDDSTFWLLQADYPSSILGIQYDSADAFVDCDCADGLLQIRGHPLTIPWTPFDDSTDILDDATKKLRITNADNPWICKVSCDKYRNFLISACALCSPCRVSYIYTSCECIEVLLRYCQVYPIQCTQL